MTFRSKTRIPAQRALAMTRAAGARTIAALAACATLAAIPAWAALHPAAHVARVSVPSVVAAPPTPQALDQQVPAPSDVAVVPAAEVPAPAAAPHRRVTPPSDGGARGPAPTVKPVGSFTLRLRSADGSLNVPVGTYSDCSGATPLFSNAAAIDTCVRDVLYFVGHNPGVFTPLTHLAVGAELTWWDSASVGHGLKIVAVRSQNRDVGPPKKASPAVVAQLQTCLVPDGSVDLILDAVSTDPAPKQVASASTPTTPATIPQAPDPAPADTPAPAPTAAPPTNPWASYFSASYSSWYSWHR